jgi:hypothetical protein
MRGKLLKYACIALICFSINPGPEMIGQTKISEGAAICNNYLYIRGESNINEFSFYYKSIPQNSSGDENSGDTLVISIPIRDFEASNPLMYKDFLELMKEDKYPRIYISFSRKQLEDAIINKPEPCPQIRITIAGITRTYLVDCMVEKCSGQYYLKGNEIIRLSDFNLKPPGKLLGLVKVNNEIDVNFGFIITFTENSKSSAKL